MNKTKLYISTKSTLDYIVTSNEMIKFVGRLSLNYRALAFQRQGARVIIQGRWIFIRGRYRLYKSIDLDS